jgi:hypothetical protein
MNTMNKINNRVNLLKRSIIFYSQYLENETDGEVCRVVPLRHREVLGAGSFLTLDVPVEIMQELLANARDEAIRELEHLESIVNVAKAAMDGYKK